MLPLSNAIRSAYLGKLAVAYGLLKTSYSAVSTCLARERVGAAGTHGKDDQVGLGSTPTECGGRDGGLRALEVVHLDVRRAAELDERDAKGRADDGRGHPERAGVRERLERGAEGAGEESAQAWAHAVENKRGRPAVDASG